MDRTEWARPLPDGVIDAGLPYPVDRAKSKMDGSQKNKKPVFTETTQLVGARQQARMTGPDFILAACRTFQRSEPYADLGLCHLRATNLAFHPNDEQLAKAKNKDDEARRKTLASRKHAVEVTVEEEAEVAGWLEATDLTVKVGAYDVSDISIRRTRCHGGNLRERWLDDESLGAVMQVVHEYLV